MLPKLKFVFQCVLFARDTRPVKRELLELNKNILRLKTNNLLRFEFETGEFERYQRLQTKEQQPKEKDER